MIFHATYLGSREMSDINIYVTQFFWNFPSLDVFNHAVSKYHDFLILILIFLTVLPFLTVPFLPFSSYRSRGALFFLSCLFFVSTLLLVFELTFISVFDFPLVSIFLLSLRIALSTDFEFTRSPCTGGSSALTAAVLLER